MSSVCGIMSRRGKPVSVETINSMTETLAHWQRDDDRSGTWRNASGTVAFGHVMLINTPESIDEILPFYHPAYRLTITADARIDNREELFRQLGILNNETKLIPDSLLILEAYQKWGRECVAHLVGDFAFAIWDEGENRLFCSRDHIGNKPMFYFIDDDVFIFATEMKGIFKVRDLPRTLDPEWIADALTVLVADKEYTPYRDIRRLPPAHWLSVSTREIKKENYWQPDSEKEILLHSEDEYLEAFREKLTESIRCRVRSVFPVGAELSGGLDSSAVAALAARLTEKQDLKFITFSHVRGEADQARASSKDESQFQEILRLHAGIKYAHSLTAQDIGVIKTLRNSLVVQDGPSHRVYGLLADVIHEAAEREGARTLLSGFGGDEVVTHPAGEYLYELTHRRDWNELWHEFHQCPEPGGKISLRTLLSNMADEYSPFLKKVYNHARARSSRETYIHPDACHIESFPITPEFFHSADIRRRIATIPRFPKMPDVRASQCRRVTHPPVSARLETCSIAAAARRLEYRCPLLDIRLLEFHLSVPSHMKRKKGYGRYLFRRSIDGVVPPEIQWRTDKSGAAIPATRHRLIRDAKEIEDLIMKARYTKAAMYIDLDQMRKRLERIVNMKTNCAPPRQGIFLNALKLLLYFEYNL